MDSGNSGGGGGDGGGAAAAAAEAAASWAARAARGADALLRFTRPHTMLGTAVSVASISCLAFGPAPWPPGAGAALLQALASALLMNVAIVGLNQLYDVDIDRVGSTMERGGAVAVGAQHLLAGWCYTIQT